MDSSAPVSSETSETSETSAAPMSKTEQLEYNRFGISVGVLALVGCMGGLAASYAMSLGLIALGVVAFATGIGLAMILALAPMRIVIGAGMVAVGIDCLIILAAQFV